MTGALTPQQARVMTFVAQGLFTKEIAALIGLSQRTVELHRSAAIKALTARNAAHAAVLWDRQQRPQP